MATLSFNLCPDKVGFSMPLYRVYVLKRGKNGSQSVQGSRTHNRSASIAKKAFFKQREKPYDENHILLLTVDGRRKYAHVFGSPVGDVDHFPLNSQINL